MKVAGYILKRNRVLVETNVAVKKKNLKTYVCKKNFAIPVNKDPVLIK